MNRILNVFTYELKRNITRPGFLFATFGLPVLLFAITFGFNWWQTRDAGEDADPTQALLEQFDFEAITAAGYVDLSDTFGIDVPEALKDIVIPFTNEDAARTALNDGEIDVFYIIQPDYAETGAVDLHIPRLQVTFLNSAPIEQLFYRTVVEDVDDLLITRLRNPMNVTEVNLQRSGEVETDELSENVEFAIVYGFVIAMMLALLMTNTYLMQSVVEERTNRLTEILISTVTPSQLLAGKILAMSVLGVFQMLVWIGGSALLYQFGNNLSAVAPLIGALSLNLRLELLPLFLVYFVLSYLLYASMFAIVGTITGSVQEGSQYVGLFVIPLVIPFYLLSLIQAAPNGTAAFAMSVIPFTAPTGMLIRMVIVDVPVIHLAVSLTLMSIVVVAAVWMAGRVFRVQTLLAGQTPKIKDLPKLIFSDGISRKRKEA